MTCDVGVLVFACLSGERQTVRRITSEVEARRRNSGIDDPVPLATVIYHLECFEERGLAHLEPIPGGEGLEAWLTEVAQSRRTTHPPQTVPSRPSFKLRLVPKD